MQTQDKGCAVIRRGRGLSVSPIARRVRELTGLSPQGFVIRARIERARRLMEESAMSLKHIAESLGYTDVYFFHRQFKSVAGVTPGQWRRAR
jgi:AraC-like DNA-binding protein